MVTLRLFLVSLHPSRGILPLLEITAVFRLSIQSPKGDFLTYNKFVRRGEKAFRAFPKFENSSQKPRGVLFHQKVYIWRRKPTTCNLLEFSHEITTADSRGFVMASVHVWHFSSPDTWVTKTSSLTSQVLWMTVCISHCPSVAKIGHTLDVSIYRLPSGKRT